MTERTALYGGLVTRFAALIVDALLLAAAVPIVALGPAGIWSALVGSAPGWVKAGSQIIAGLLPLAYFTVFWWGTGQTPGDVLFGVVVRHRTHGHIGIVRAFLRAFVGLLLPVLWLLGMGLIITDGKRRALHDRLFGTVVMHKAALVTTPDDSPQPA